MAQLVAKTSFEDTVATLSHDTGAPVPKRQVEDVSEALALDFDAYYEGRSTTPVREEAADKKNHLRKQGGGFLRMGSEWANRGTHRRAVAGSGGAMGDHMGLWARCSSSHGAFRAEAWTRRSQHVVAR